MAVKCLTGLRKAYIGVQYLSAIQPRKITE